MKTKFTPGPWHVETSGDNDDITEIYICKEGGGIILCINDGDDNYDIEGDLANAELIASAPKMYRALKDLMHHYETHGQLLSWDVDIARQALNKAT